MPAHPLVTVEIRGVNRAGKSTLAHLFRGMLAQHEIPTRGAISLARDYLAALGVEFDDLRPIE